MDMGHGPLDTGELLVVAPALVGVGLGQRRELGRALGVRPLEDREARLGSDEVGDRDRSAALESSLNGWPPSISDGWNRYSGQ